MHSLLYYITSSSIEGVLRHKLGGKHMLLNVNYSDVRETGAKGEVDGKKVNFFMVVNIDEANFAEAVDRLGTTKGVVAFNFIGSPAFLQDSPLVRTVSKPVIVKVQLDTVNMIDIQQTMIAYPQTVRVVFELPKGFNNMKFIHDESKKYPNIRFEGGNLIRLAGCKIGAIGVDDIPRKIALSRLKLTPAESGEFSAMKLIHIDNVDIVEFYPYRDVKPKSPKAPKLKSAKTPREKGEPKAKTKSTKPKKQLSSLLNLQTATDGLDNF